MIHFKRNYWVFYTGDSVTCLKVLVVVMIDMSIYRERVNRFNIKYSYVQQWLSDLL